MAKQLKPRDEATTDDILNEAKKAAPKVQEPTENQATNPDLVSGAQPVSSVEPNPSPAEKPAEQPVKEPTQEPKVVTQDKEQGVSHASADLEREAREAEEREAQEKADLEKKRLLKKYGPDYVEATRDGLGTIFTRSTWNQLKPDKMGRRDGWMESVKIPPEVAHLGKPKV